MVDIRQYLSWIAIVDVTAKLCSAAHALGAELHSAVRLIITPLPTPIYLSVIGYSAHFISNGSMYFEYSIFVYLDQRKSTKTKISIEVLPPTAPFGRLADPTVCGYQ